MRLPNLLLATFASGAIALAAFGPLGLLTSKEEVPLPQGRWTAPVPSPDGRYLAFTSEKYRGLELLDLETGTRRTLCGAEGAGFHAAWAGDSCSIAFRTSTGGADPRLRIVVAHPDGTTETASPLERSLSLPQWYGSELLFARFEGERPLLHRAGPEGDPGDFTPALTSPGGHLWIPAPHKEEFRPASVPDKVFYLPVPSPDGKRFVVECLDGHLYLGSTTGEEFQDLGPGTYPSFVREGSALLFERTEDDGHALVASDIFLMELKTREVRAVTATANSMERRPRMAGDGHTLYFEEGGRIFKGWVP